MKQDKHRISVRLNGKEQVFHEDNADDLEQIVQEEIASSEDVFEPVERIKPHTPKIIDLGSKRKERKKESFWDDGNRNRSPKLPFKRKKKKGDKRTFSFSNVPLALIAVAISAVIVGVSFGFMVLTFFGDTTSIESTPVTADGTIDLLAEQGTSSLPDLSVEVVQGGAFSSKEKGEVIAQSLQEEGFAAAITNSGDPYYMFIGLGSNREQAKSISELYEQAGHETYVKTYAIKAEIKVEDENVLSSIAQGSKIFQGLLSISGDAFSGKIISSEELEKVKTALVDWKKILESKEALSKEQTAGLQSFMGSMEEANRILITYQETPNKQLLWEIQTQLLKGLLSYELLVKK